MGHGVQTAGHQKPLLRAGSGIMHDYLWVCPGSGWRGSLTARWLPSEPCLLVALVNQDGFYVFTVSEVFKIKRLSVVLVERRWNGGTFSLPVSDTLEKELCETDGAQHILEVMQGSSQHTHFLFPQLFFSPKLSHSQIKRRSEVQRGVGDSVGVGGYMRGRCVMIS